MTYAFRLRFRMNKPITSDDKKLKLSADGDTTELHLNALDGDLRSTKWFSIRSGGYKSAEEAATAAQRFGDILLCIGVERWAGVDVGKGVATVRLFDGFRAKLEAEVGGRVRDNIHGIDVFEDGDVKFFGLHAQGTVSDGPAHFVQAFQKLQITPPSLTARQRVCLELINDSLFEGSADAQLVLRISAIEALCERTERPEGIRELITPLLEQLPKTNEADPIRQALGQATKQGIGEASRKSEGTSRS
jgi:hypothetical protein